MEKDAGEKKSKFVCELFFIESLNAGNYPETQDNKSHTESVEEKTFRYFHRFRVPLFYCKKME